MFMKIDYELQFMHFPYFLTNMQMSNVPNLGLDISE